MFRRGRKTEYYVPPVLLGFLKSSLKCCGFYECVLPDTMVSMRALEASSLCLDEIPLQYTSIELRDKVEIFDGERKPKQGREKEKREQLYSRRTC